MFRYNLLILFFICFISCDLTSADEYYNISIDYAEKEDYKRSIQFLDKAINKKDDFRAALRNRAALKNRLGDFKGAIDDYKKILEFDEENTLALVFIGNNYRRLNKSQEAIKFFNLSLKTEGATKTFGQQDGGTLTFNGINYDLSTFDNNSDYFIQDCEIFYYRGLAFEDIGNYKKALLDFNRSLESNCIPSWNYLEIGKVYQLMNDSINACDNYIKSARLKNQEAREEIKDHCLKKKKD